MKILVTGGAGYIGSHTIVDLMDHGFELISVDNLSNADGTAYEGIAAITGKRPHHYEIDLTDLAATRRIFEEHSITGIIHFAAFKSVNESVQKPLEYYHNNVNSLTNLLRLASEFGVGQFIFSSSCSVYGNSTALPVLETTPLQKAECPYAYTKQIGEQILEDYKKVHPEIRIISLRYFNPAGAHPSAKIGESSLNAPTNLVPVITETAIGKRDKMTVFGSDYTTRDGTCIRDYIHVMDLANAHTKALQLAQRADTVDIVQVFNLGIGEGVSVMEAIKAFEKVSGQALAYELGPRREGDVMAIYADISKAKDVLAWSPKNDIEQIMKTAWAWEKVRSAVHNKG